MRDIQERVRCARKVGLIVMAIELRGGSASRCGLNNGRLEEEEEGVEGGRKKAAGGRKVDVPFGFSSG